MINTIDTIALADSIPYLVLHPKGTANVINAATMTAVAYVDANFAQYAVAMTQKGTGSTLFSWTISGSLPANDYIYEIRNCAAGSPVATNAVTTDGFIKSGEILWDGTAATGTASIGTNVATVGSLRTVLQNNVRNAGVIGDAANTDYPPIVCDYAIQRCLSILIDRTRCTPKISSVTMPAGSQSIDFSALTGFETQRILRQGIWAYPAAGTNSHRISVDVVSQDEVDEYVMHHPARTGHPKMIGFSTTTGSNTTAHVADVDYTVKVHWFTPLVSWTMGDSGASNVVVNIPANFAIEAVATGASAFMQGNEVAQLAIVNMKNPQWELLVQRTAGAVNFGNRSLRRKSIDQIRHERDW